MKVAFWIFLLIVTMIGMFYFWAIRSIYGVLIAFILEIIFIIQMRKAKFGPSMRGPQNGIKWHPLIKISVLLLIVYLIYDLFLSKKI